jgi:hypothetical protein
MNTKENWINDVENSLNGLSPAEVNPYLYSKITSRINAKKAVAPLKLVWGVAMAFLLLLFINVVAIKMSSGSGQKNNSELQVIANQYQLINDNSISYN